LDVKKRFTDEQIIGVDARPVLTSPARRKLTTLAR
jgi:hypothetical protein